MAFKKIILIGYTGALGSQILRALLLTFPPSSLTLLTRQRHPDRSTLPAEINLHTVSSYTSRAILTILRGHDVLISALNTLALDQESALVDLCIEAGVRRFVPSEFTMDVLDPGYKRDAKTKVARDRVAWAEKLAQLGEEGRVEYTSVVCGPFVDYCLETGFWPFDIKGRRATVFDGGEVRRTGCSLRFVGECVAAILRMPEGETRNRRVRVREVEYTGNGIVEALERATGSKWTVEEKASNELARKEEEEIGNGKDMEGYFNFVVRGNFDGSAYGSFEDGLSFGSEGEGMVARRTLDEIVGEVVKSNGVK